MEKKVATLVDKFLILPESEVFFSGNRMVRFKGKWGSVVRFLGGEDLHFFDNRMFILTKKSFQFLKYFFIKGAAGVSGGLFVKMDLVGLGFRFLKIGNKFYLKVGYGHYIEVTIPSSVHVVGYKRRILIFGIDRESLYNFASQLRLQKKPDAYKGKGILFHNEELNLKVGKQK
jgi:hypothetical protein